MDDGQQRCLIMTALVVLGIGVILTVVLVPMSFSGLDYYEMGFKRQKSTGTVNTEKVYGFGKYMIGPDYEFKVFPASANTVELDLRVFTKNKLEIEVKFYFQYFLRKEDLQILHKYYDIVYEPTIISSATAALKIESPRYTTNEFIQNRSYVEAGLFQVTRERLGGTCCAADCSSWDHACPDGCKDENSCNVEKDKGLWVDVKFFQLGGIKIPNDVSDRYLKALTLQEDNLREEFMQKASVERKEATAEVEQIKNEAREKREVAHAESALIDTKSRANYTAIVEKARSQGLKDLYTRLNINDEKIKNSFDYLRTLRGLSNIHLTVDFNQRIVGGFN